MIGKIFSKEMALILLTLGIAFAAFNTGNNIQWLMFSIPTATMVVAVILNRMNLKKVKIEIMDAQDIFAGQVAYIPVKIMNMKRFRNVYNLFLSFYFNFKGGTISDVYVGRVEKNSSRIILVEVNFPNRGLHKLEYVKIMSSFPFDLFKSRRVVKVNKDILVYPALIKAKADMKYFVQDEGTTKRHRGGMGAEVVDLLSYTGTEPLRNIYWKLYAKKDELWVKDFGSEEAEQNVIYLNWALIPPLKREYAISLAAGLMMKYYEMKNKWRLISSDFDSNYGNSVFHLRRCLSYLALLKDYSNKSDAKMPVLFPEKRKAVDIANYIRTKEGR